MRNGIVTSRTFDTSLTDDSSINQYKSAMQFSKSIDSDDITKPVPGSVFNIFVSCVQPKALSDRKWADLVFFVSQND